MKIKNKILILGLILIVLTGIFIPTTKIQAQVKGECEVVVYPQTVPATPPGFWPDYTENGCHTATRPQNPTANVTYVGWVANPTCTAPLALVSGSCVCTLPWGEMKNGVCVAPSSTTCTNPPTNTLPQGCTPPAAASKIYNLLAPLPCDPNATPAIPGCDSTGKLTTYDPTGKGGGALGAYLNLMIKLFIGICAVLAVIMIVIGGIEYMTTELVSSKEAGKERIRNAIFGLLLALGAWTLLNTINPDLLNTDLKSLADVTVEVTAQNFSSSPSTYLVPLGKTGQASNTNCDENTVATSNQTASAGLSDAQIHTLACIGGIESGCQKVGTTNYNWNKGSSAYGPFQIVLQTNARCFENPVCRSAAGVSGPLNCAAGFRGGNPIPDSPIVEQCKKAADNFTCSVAAAACLIKESPNYSPWNANPNLSKCK